MTRSRRRKLIRLGAAGVPFASAMLAGAPAAYAQAQTADAGGLEEVVVTAQKREENLQNVPLSIQAINTAKLEELHVNNFNDYARYLPSVAYQTGGPGYARVYMRGVAAGDNGNHSGSVPSVGTYLDEQPITTITGALDVHIYDIARVEALAGPQGTLYGASSQAGTIRIITNKPDSRGFAAGYNLEGNLVSHGDAGYVAEGFVNVPISDNVAARVVGWSTRAGGYIDNIPGTRTYPTSGITDENSDVAEKNFNEVETNGARAALKVDLNDSWTITPAVMMQQSKSGGNFAQDHSIDRPLSVAHFYPERSDDHWVQAALTVEGKISNFDLVYAGAYLKRNVEAHSDYTDYSFFYDICCSYGASAVDDNGDLINPGQFIVSHDNYAKQSHELRLSTSQDNRVRAVGGLFYQRQTHDIEQRYQIKDFSSELTVTGWPETLWLTKQDRVDRDRAIFGEVSFDVTSKLTLTGGARYFKARNSLGGFYGFSGNFSPTGTGESQCFAPASTPGAPCTNLDKTVSQSGWSPKGNITYHLDDRKLVYATYSRGFRPGGVNRRGTFPPYKADYLNNYEAGWKTSWVDNRLRLNGAFFYEKWKDFQYSFLGANGLTNVTNAKGATIKGVEADINWALTPGLQVSGGIALLRPKLSDDFCEELDEDGNQLNPCPDISFAPSGSKLPISPKFKSNLTARYGFPLGTFEAHVQASYIYQTKSKSALLPTENAILQDQPSYGIADFSASIDTDKFSFEVYMTNAFDKRIDVTRYVECATEHCGPEVYGTVNQPRLIGVRFGQKF